MMPAIARSYQETCSAIERFLSNKAGEQYL